MQKVTRMTTRWIPHPGTTYRRRWARSSRTREASRTVKGKTTTRQMAATRSALRSSWPNSKDNCLPTIANALRNPTANWRSTKVGLDVEVDHLFSKLMPSYHYQGIRTSGFLRH